jgi:hypothetical protein
VNNRRRSFDGNATPQPQQQHHQQQQQQQLQRDNSFLKVPGDFERLSGWMNFVFLFYLGVL